MAVKMRLSRAGVRKAPFYHVVVADGRMPRDGRFLEQVGTFDPGVEPPAVHFEQARVDYWLSKGAQPSEAVANLLKRVRPVPAR
ncbi:MAG: 30S ribosomal protein S16 [Myxococcales bacterium]